MGRLSDFHDCIERTSFDREFREKFLQNPRETLRSEGFDISDDIELVVLLDEPKKFFIIVPEYNLNPEHSLPIILFLMMTAKMMPIKNHDPSHENT